VFEELVLLVDGSGSTMVPTTQLASLELKEREHLQEWVLKHPQVLGDGVRIVAREYDGWQSASGDPVRDRLDVLGLAPDGRLVVGELKRGVAPHSIHMQAINYAAMVSRLSCRDVAELYVKDQRRHGTLLDVEAVLTEFETGFLLNEESVRTPRIVLVAAEFPTSVTTSVVWLNERSVDISLVRYRAYRLESGQVMVTFSRFFPVPSVEEFTVGRLRTTDNNEATVTAEPWNEAALRRLAERGNVATVALLDLCAASEEPVGVSDIQTHAGLTYGQVRGQLAGFTMLLRNKRNGFKQSGWPVHITWLPGGVASYKMEPGLRSMWTMLRANAQTPASLTTANPAEDVDQATPGSGAVGASS
jgi:hypothetical protein